jgi:3-dehydroquinate synthase
VSHGEAVAIGMITAARISNRMGTLEKKEITRLKKIIANAGLPTSPPKLGIKKILQALKHDKKNLQGTVRFVLLRSIGDAYISDDVSPALIEQILTDWN